MVTPDSVLKWSEWAADSPLYQQLCVVVAEDDELMRVINRIEHRPQINIMFAAVQYLIAKGEGDDLAGYYPNLTPTPLPAAGVDAEFRDFILQHEAEIVEIGATRYTQTNECRRCVALLPMLWMTGLETFHLIDVGTSAGLNLLIDRYHYRWDNLEWGPQSPVRLEAISKGTMPDPVDIAIAGRTGIDLNPVDPRVPDERIWLEALVWPEHHGRRERLRAALEVAESMEIELVAGDALEVLPQVMESLPEDLPIVVMNSFVLNQFSDDQRSEFHELTRAARLRRQVYTVSMEAVAGHHAPVATLSVDTGSGPEEVGVGHHHGEWVEFYVRP